MGIVYCESLKSFRCPYPEIRISSLLMYMSDVKGTLLAQPYLTVGTTKRSETFTINYSLGPISVQIFKSKFSFPEGDHSFLLKNTVKMQYLINNKLLTRNLFRVFVAHQGLHDAHSPDSKVREQLVAFSRQTNYTIIFVQSSASLFFITKLYIPLQLQFFLRMIGSS